MDPPRALTTLTEIRSLELEMARRIDDVRSEVETAVADATRDARQLVAEARERGVRQADARYEHRVAAAVDEADRIRLDGQAAAADLLVAIRPQLLDLVDAMVDVVLATASDEGA